MKKWLLLLVSVIHLVYGGRYDFDERSKQHRISFNIHSAQTKRLHRIFKRMVKLPFEQIDQLQVEISEYKKKLDEVIPDFGEEIIQDNTKTNQHITTNDLIKISSEYATMIELLEKRHAQLCNKEVHNAIK